MDRTAVVVVPAAVLRLQMAVFNLVEHQEKRPAVSRVALARELAVKTSIRSRLPPHVPSVRLEQEAACSIACHPCWLRR